MAREVVVIEYSDLKADADLSTQLLKAWGEGGLGIIAIRGIPEWLDLYPAVLRQAHALAHLPAASLRALEDEASMYNAGWSHGKEKLGDKPDFAKGSFYFNPLCDAPGTEDDLKTYPWAMPRNRWPPDLPDLEGACKRLGERMHEAACHLARLVDRCMEGKVAGYNGQLGNLIRDTQKCKGRLLYYFPPEVEAVSPLEKRPRPADGEEAVQEDGWIGWHSDSGYLTALAPDIYVDDATGEELDNPDPEGAGLWVVTREGDAVRVSLPRDCMCVQVGECVQVVTGGMLVATPHCVRGCRPSSTKGRRVARVSCPCFIDVHPSQPVTMPAGHDRDTVLAKGLSSKVPPLGERWTTDGQTFGDFLGESFRRYYEWTTKGS